jgi:hypothetical protein
MEKKLWRHKTKDRQVWAYYLESTIDVGELPVELQSKLLFAPNNESMNLISSPGLEPCRFPLYLYQADNGVFLAHKSWFENRYELLEPMKNVVEKKHWKHKTKGFVVAAYFVESAQQLKSLDEYRICSVKGSSDDSSAIRIGDVLYKTYPVYIYKDESSILRLDSAASFEREYELVEPIEGKKVEKWVEIATNEVCEAMLIESEDEFRSQDGWGYLVDSTSKLGVFVSNVEDRIFFPLYIVSKKKGISIHAKQWFENHFERMIEHVQGMEHVGTLLDFGEENKIVECYEKAPVSESTPKSSVRTYRKVHTEVQAIQFNGENFEECKAFCPDLSYDEFGERMMYGTFGTMTCRITPKDAPLYFVKNHKGYCVKTAKEFEAEYGEIQYRAIQEPNSTGRLGLYVYNGIAWEEVQHHELPSHLRTMDCRNGYKAGEKFSFGIDPIDMEEAKKNAEKSPYQTGALAGFGSVKKEEGYIFPRIVENFEVGDGSYQTVEEYKDWYRSGYKDKNGNWYLSGEGETVKNAAINFLQQMKIHIEDQDRRIRSYWDGQEVADGSKEEDEPTSMTERLTEDDKSVFQSWLDENFPKAELSTTMRLNAYSMYLQYIHFKNK